MANRTIFFNSKPKIIGAYSVVGPKESESAFKGYFDEVLSDDKFGESTFEKAECKMLSKAISSSIARAGYSEKDINAILSGDLLNQIISASFAARDFDVSYIGIYNACSTFSEGIALASAFLDGNYFKNVVVSTCSHFSTAERQYRYPLELGCTRPPQSQWTVTGAGSVVLSNEKEGEYPVVSSATFGKVVDFGVTDANDMGAAMAPAAADTLKTLFFETSTSPKDYDLIVTGDLGALGTRLLKRLCLDNGFDIDENHVDCGEMIYDINEKEFQGGSGAGCSAVVFSSYFYDLLKKGKIGKMILMATGALLSTLSSQQGESIPGVAHAVIIEGVK